MARPRTGTSTAVLFGAHLLVVAFAGMAMNRAWGPVAGIPSSLAVGAIVVTLHAFGTRFKAQGLRVQNAGAQRMFDTPDGLPQGVMPLLPPILGVLVGALIGWALAASFGDL